jgi:hypothetical protein
MSKDRDADMAALLRAVVDGDALELAEPEVEAVSPFAAKLSGALAEAIAVMRGEGIIEVEDDYVDALVAEAVEAGLDTKSPKQLVKRVIRTLLESDSVEEVYGTDHDIEASLRRLLGGD